MKREERYIVLKLTDLDAALTPPARECLERLCDLVALQRALTGKRPFQAVIIEDDWPEFEPVWGMLERRVDGANHGSKCDHVWHENPWLIIPCPECGAK